MLPSELLGISPEKWDVKNLYSFCSSGEMMFALGKDPALVTHYVRRLRGGSQPILARASDGHLYVVKFANNLQGPNLLFNESAGNELYRACGLPVPDWAPLWVSDSFLDENPSCWMQTPVRRLRPASGLCFGSRFLGEGGRRLFEILPSSSFNRIHNRADFWLAWLIDSCAEHMDNRQAVFVEDSDGGLDAYFVDNGHLFGGPMADLKRDFGASHYFDQRIYGQLRSEGLLGFHNVLQALDSDRLRETISAIPCEWSRTSAREGFERGIQRLKVASLVQYVVETLIGDLERRTETESETFGIERKLPPEVLRTGLQVPGTGRAHTRLSNCA